MDEMMPASVAPADDSAQTRLFVALCAETQSSCNRRCWFCKFGQPRERLVREQMPLEMIELILLNLRDLDYTGRVSWFMTNEPLLDPRIYDIVSLTKRFLPTCCCSLLTNGDRLTDGVIARLKEAGLDRLGVSAYDDATYARIAALDRADQITRILDRRPPKEETFVESRGGKITLLTLPTQMSVPPDVALSDCRRPSTMINIHPNGDVVLCCADYYGDSIMGNVRENRLEEIWFGDRFDNYRRHLADRGRTGLTLCSDCTYHGGGHSRDFP